MPFTSRKPERVFKASKFKGSKEGAVAKRRRIKKEKAAFDTETKRLTAKARAGAKPKQVVKAKAAAKPKPAPKKPEAKKPPVRGRAAIDAQRRRRKEAKQRRTHPAMPKAPSSGKARGARATTKWLKEQKEAEAAAKAVGGGRIKEPKPKGSQSMAARGRRNAARAAERRKAKRCFRP